MLNMITKQQAWVFMTALLVGMGGILYGYDIGVVSGALLFIQKGIHVDRNQIGLIVGAVFSGGLVGTLITGPLADKFGRRIMIAMSCIVFIAGVVFILLSKNFLMLMLARVLLGVGVGIVAVAVPLYVAELVPDEDRGKYVTFFQLFLTFGIVLAYFVDLAFTPSGNWRGMFAVVAIPAIILLVGIVRLPESPRWLIAQGRIKEATKVLRLTRSKQAAATDLIKIHNSVNEMAGTWRELFSKKLMAPLLIAVSIAILNQLTGINAFLQYAPVLLKNAGLKSNMIAMLASAGIGTVNFIVTLIAITLVDRIGRRPLLLVGIVGVIVSEIYLGFVSHMVIIPFYKGIFSMMGLFGFIIFFAIGPGVVVWLAISELLPTKVRGKAMALCLFFNSLAATVLASSFPFLTDHIGVTGTYWLCAVFSGCYFLIAYFLLPETKEKSLEDIEKYFRKQPMDI